MIESVSYKNYRVLRDSHLPLGRFTLIVGPNGSGKSTALRGIRAAGGSIALSERDLSHETGAPIEQSIEIAVRLQKPQATFRVSYAVGTGRTEFGGEGASFTIDQIRPPLAQMPIYALEAEAIARVGPLQAEAQLTPTGQNLAVVLDRLRDRDHERFERLNAELNRWLPDFDRVLFDTTPEGQRGFMLRTAGRGEAVAAADLSQGVLSALAILTLAYLPQVPSLIAFEEPDRGIHPRLLRDVRDALYRLAYPQDFGESRAPVQVIATTHSPYLLDLYRDHPEEVVIAQKLDDNVRFERLSDRPDVDEILRDTPLGEAWYSGILGGVPAAP